MNIKERLRQYIEYKLEDKLWGQLRDGLAMEKADLLLVMRERTIRVPTVNQFERDYLACFPDAKATNP